MSKRSTRSFLTCSVVPVPVLLRSPSPFWGSSPPPVAAAAPGKEPARPGVGKVPACPRQAPGPPSFLRFLAREPQVLFPAGDAQRGLRLHWLQSFLSKSYLTPLLRRLQGLSWQGAGVVEAFKSAVGKPSFIKANRWPTQSGVLLGHEWWREGRQSALRPSASCRERGGRQPL